MLDRIDEYCTTLQAHSGPLMPFIEWRPTLNRNVEVLNQTADLYRYFDCTSAAEFLYACVARTVEQDLPREIEYLRRHDEAIRRIMDTVEMPDRVAENLVLFIRQNGGTLSKRRRTGDYQKLLDEEVVLLKVSSAMLLPALKTALTHQPVRIRIVNRNGAPGMIRTCDPLVRSQILYPAELRAQQNTV
jgi:hypothetical protein